MSGRVDSLEACIRLTGQSDKELCIESTKRFFRYLYVAYSTLEKEFGRKKAEKLYWKNLWKPLLDIKSVMNSLGIKKMKDLLTIAKVEHAFYAGAPCLQYITQPSRDKVVVVTTFCPNPIYGSRRGDRYIDRARFYSVEVKIPTLNLMKRLIDYAGQTGKVEARIDKAICLGDDVCQFVFEKKEVSKIDRKKK